VYTQFIYWSAVILATGEHIQSWTHGLKAHIDRSVIISDVRLWNVGRRIPSSWYWCWGAYHMQSSSQTPNATKSSSLLHYSLRRDVFMFSLHSNIWSWQS